MIICLVYQQSNISWWLHYSGFMLRTVDHENSQITIALVEQEIDPLRQLVPWEIVSTKTHSINWVGFFPIPLKNF